MRRKSSPQLQERSVHPDSFYGSQKTNDGSAHTTYIPPELASIPNGHPAHRSHSLPPEYTESLDVPELVPVNKESEGEGDTRTLSTYNWTQSLNVALTSNVPIDGRDEKEESEWWNSELRTEQQRPGPGMLPTMALTQVYTLPHYAVDVSIPSFAQSTGETSSTTVSPIPPSSFILPSQTEMELAKPHLDAYFCPSRNSWRVIHFAVGPAPQLVKPSGFSPLPDDSRRKQVNSCIAQQGRNQTNLNHHIHFYRDAVSMSTAELTLEPNLRSFSSELPPTSRSDNSLLDLYICCQCSFYALTSPYIPGIIDGELLKTLVSNRLENPLPGLSGHDSVLAALDVLLKAVENNIWKGETRSLSVTGKTFQKLGWSQTVMQIFRQLNYELPSISVEVPVVKPPKLDTVSQTSRDNRRRLLRAWVEVNAFIACFLQSIGTEVYPSQNDHISKQVFPASVKLPSLSVRLLDALPALQISFNASHDANPLELEPDSRDRLDWQILGLAPFIFSADMIEFAYRAQCRCDPENTPRYLTCVKSISTLLPLAFRTQISVLDSLLALEYSRGKWSEDHVPQAAASIGFGKDGDLKVDWSSEIDDNFAIAAWKDSMRRAWTNPADSGQRRKELSESFRVLAEDRGSIAMIKALRDHNSNMDPDQAFRTLEVPKDVEEGMLLMVYQMRVEEQPLQLERMKQALEVIADITDSSRLRTFLDTGIDPGEQFHQHPPEWPRGLNQLGNTCYLNSLLQYFYTIKDLREAVAPLKTITGNKLTLEDISRCRVGGRLVSQREIDRSKRFVSQLANLFSDLECSGSHSVTPSLELAKLALVTSKDEDEDGCDARKGGTDTSTSTDATLVEELLPLPSPSRQSSPLENASSVLGKRGRNEEHGVPISDVDMELTKGDEAQYPPLPPRRKPERRSDSVMMFGKQHDVAECMDNCLFQIEAALLQTGSGLGPDDDRLRLVKSLFYGKMRQRVTPVQEDSEKSTIHVKDDVFSHLPVNVFEEGFDLYDGLETYFEDTVELEGKTAKMDVSLIELPPILQIQLQRVQFDRKSGQAFKSNAYVRFNESLVMDRFLEDVDPAMKDQSRTINEELRSCRERLQTLVRGEHLSYEAHLQVAAGFLSKDPFYDNGHDIGQLLTYERTRLCELVDTLRARIQECKTQVELLWSKNNAAEYELASVFIHRGSSPSWGHYFFYTRHLPENPDSWFKMNDSEVTVVPKEEVLADTTSSTANAYLLVYARKGSGVIQTVKREVSTKANIA